MIRFNSIIEWQNYLNEVDGSIGFVPTMGALHDGHLSLVQKSMQENDHTLVSIFVNPTQFNNPDDLENYPNLIEEDLNKLQKIGVDFVFMPSAQEIYIDDYAFKVTEDELSKKLCGAHRPGHFDGVLTVVLKLLIISQACKAYFGEKDFQQFSLIQRMTQAFFLPTEIISCPTIREEDGLAMSSRNLRLSKNAREKAANIYKLITSNLNKNEIIDKLNADGFKTDYLEDIDNRRYIATTIEGIRLIDNVKI